jgi:uncharacterized oxidoreductase
MSFLNSTSTEKSTILITGGGSGIGLALATRLSDLGHTVIIAGRTQAVLEDAKSAHPKLNIIQGDVGSDVGRIALFEQVIKDFPEVNVLVNNAGTVCFFTPLNPATMPVFEKQREVFEVNLIAAVHLSVLFIPHFVTKKHSAIINNSSVSAFVPIAPCATYAASKGFIFNKTLSS